MQDKIYLPLLLVAIALVAFFAYLNLKLTGLPQFDVQGTVHLLFQKTLYVQALKDLAHFTGGYALDLWGLFVFFSMASLIFWVGGLWTNYCSEEAIKNPLPIKWALGSATLSLIWFFFASIKLIQSNIAFILLALGLAIGISRLPTLFIQLKKYFIDFKSWTNIDKFTALFLFGWSMVWVANAFIPETWYDSLEYQLGLPSYYIANREFKPNPNVLFSYINQNAQMVYVWSLLAKSEVALKLWNFSFLLMLDLAVYSFIKKLTYRFCGLIAVLMMNLMPMMIWQTTYASNDLQTTFYLLSGWILLVNNQLFLSGCCLGAAFGTKYTALGFILCCFVGALILYYKKANRGQWFKNLSVWLIGLSLFAFPWIIRNTIYTKNPIYPFYQKIFKNNPIKNWHTEQVFLGLAPPKGDQPRALIKNYKQLIGALIGIEYNNTVMYQTGWILGIFIIGIVPFLHQSTVDFKIAQASAVVALLGLLQMSGMVMNPRYAMMCIIFFLIPVASAISALANSRWKQAMLLGTILSNLFFHGTLKNLTRHGIQPWTLALVGAGVERFDFTVPLFPFIGIHDFNAMNQFCEKNINDNGKVLMIGIFTPYRFTRPFHYSAYIDRQRIDELLDSCQEPAQLRDLMLNSNLNYVLFDALGWKEYVQNQFSTMTPEKFILLNKFFKLHARQMANTQNLILFKITN